MCQNTDLEESKQIVEEKDAPQKIIPSSCLPSFMNLNSEKFADYTMRDISVGMLQNKKQQALIEMKKAHAIENKNIALLKQQRLEQEPGYAGGKYDVNINKVEAAHKTQPAMNSQFVSR